MKCDSCQSKAVVQEQDEPKGCQSKGSCATGACNRLNTFDWLADMQLPDVEPFEIIEVKFKGGRKAFCRNIHQLPLVTGDAVVIEVERGFHIGHVALQGELVRLQMKKKNVKLDDEAICTILRIATPQDKDRLIEARNRELPTMYRAREVIENLGLSMKLSDVEYQADCTKATFYYSADARVDFRELIRLLAAEFRIRIEMRQINLRQEASRVGGIGVCGRELCCSTWLTDFKTVNTSAARYQNLSLNTAKLSGQCGKLKCCLNYELDTYLDALKDIPEVKGALLTEQGEAKLQKTDIFKKLMWFSYPSESVWYPLTVEEVRKIQQRNAKGEYVPSLNPKDWNTQNIEANQLDNHIIDAEEFERNVRKKEDHIKNTPSKSSREKRKKRIRVAQNNEQKPHLRRRSQKKPPQQ